MKEVIRSTCLAIVLLTTDLHTLSYSHAFSSAKLHSFESQTYSLTFSGSVRSSDEPKVAVDVSAEATTSQREKVEATTTTGSNGSFSVTLSFKSYPEESLDWTLTLQTAHAGLLVMEGRQILSDKTDLRIEKSIQLTEGQLALAVH